MQEDKIVDETFGRAEWSQLSEFGPNSQVYQEMNMTFVCQGYMPTKYSRKAR